MRLVVNEDTTFLIADETGDIPVRADYGLYYEDTRFLSRYELRLDGQPPVYLSAHAPTPETAVHFLTNPLLPSAAPAQLALIRRRLVGRGLREELEAVNYGQADATFELTLRLDADFAHIFEVKHQTEARQPPPTRHRGTQVVAGEDSRTLRFALRRERPPRYLDVRFSVRPDVLGPTCRFRVRVGPRKSWRLTIQFVPAGDEPQAVPARHRDAAALERRVQRHRELVGQAPRLETDSYVLREAYARAVEDFSALCVRAEEVSAGDVWIAAGIPWFLALFGRDSLITAYQALRLYPDVAKGVLRTLARYQGRRLDRRRDEEPGKILHEYRYGVVSCNRYGCPPYPYYGTVDATPLFLMLYGTVFRVTSDREFARSMLEAARRAVDWLDRFGDRDGDGYVEYLRQARAGLANQGWKDSWDSVRFHDGRLAEPPIALCEVQGYAYAARLSLAEVLEALGHADDARRLRTQAAELKARFNRDFWLADRGFLAEALDRNKAKVDALTSNAGHALWTGIADRDVASAVAARLVSAEFFSGWGVRTMAASEPAYNPISYHNGSVWPHDNSLIVTGMAGHGFAEAAATVADGLLQALSYQPDWRFPELFAGYGRDEAPFPVDYPTACRPQAWATGSVFLLITAMLGLTADPWLAPGQEPEPFLPAGINWVRLVGLWLNGRRVAAEAVRTAAGEVVRRVEPV